MARLCSPLSSLMTKFPFRLIGTKMQKPTAAAERRNCYKSEKKLE
jgi:hypothetical protein